MKQTALDFAALPSHQQDDFVVSDCNRLVWQWLEKWPDWPSYGAIIVGPTASGKTHLLHGWATRAGAVMVDEQGTTHYPSQPMAVDNADRWGGKACEQRLFHLLNSAKEQQQSILLTATTPPNQWDIALDDLRSRLLSLPVWELRPPDDALLVAVLSKHFSDRQLLVDPAVIQYIVTRSERSFETISDIARSIDAYALQAGRSVTTALVRSWMEEHACAN